MQYAKNCYGPSRIGQVAPKYVPTVLVRRADITMFREGQVPTFPPQNLKEKTDMKGSGGNGAGIMHFVRK